MTDLTQVQSSASLYVSNMYVQHGKEFSNWLDLCVTCSTWEGVFKLVRPVCHIHTGLHVCYPHTSSCPDNTLIHMAQLFQKPKQLTQLPLVVYKGLLQNSLPGDQQSKLCILFMLLSLVCLLLCFLNEAQNQIKGSHNCHRETQLAHLLTNLFLHHTHRAHTLTAMYM